MNGFDSFIWFFLLFIGLAVLGGVLKVAFWFWFMYRVSRGAGQVIQNYNQQVVQLYNQAVESWLIQIARAIQEGQRQEEVLALQRQAVQQIRQLPRRERKTYEHRLSDVVSGRMKLDTATGEWK